MQNIRIGVVVSVRPVAVKSRRPAPWPCWKIQTMAPKVAVRLRVLSTSAFTGTRIEPNMANSRTKVATAIHRAAHGTSSKMAAFTSTC